MTPIPATEVLRVLQRVANGTAKDVRVERDMVFSIFADGWQIDIFDDAGVLDGVYFAQSPDGVTAELSDWPIGGDPTDLLSEVEAEAILAMNEG